MFWQIFTFILVFCSVSNAFALSTDKAQIAYIQADSARIDHKQGISVYSGHVRLTQGTTVITADTLTLYTNQQNRLQNAMAVGQQAQPATYSSLPDNSKMPFIAAAKTINYHPQQALVELIGDAKATQGSDSFIGPKINYDIKQQIVVSPQTKEGRTTIIIQPQQKINLPS